MNSQLSFNSSQEYEDRSRFGTFMGFICGKPVYSEEYVSNNPFILQSLDRGDMFNTPRGRYALR